MLCGGPKMQPTILISQVATTSEEWLQLHTSSFWKNPGTGKSAQGMGSGLRWVEWDGMGRVQRGEGVWQGWEGGDVAAGSGSSSDIQSPFPASIPLVRSTQTCTSKL